MENKVDVVICGEIYTLKSSENEDYLQRLARYIDQKRSGILEKNPAALINERVRTLLIALNVADDYFKTVDEFTRLQSENEPFLAEIGRLQEENKRLTKKLSLLQGENEAMVVKQLELQKELDEFIAAFDSARATENDNILTLPPLEARKAASR